jgi:hypothetical protein
MLGRGEIFLGISTLLVLAFGMALRGLIRNHKRRDGR